MDPVSFTWCSVIGLALVLSIMVLKWWFAKNDKREKEKADAKKEISDAVASGDVARIHRIIDRMRR